MLKPHDALNVLSYCNLYTLSIFMTTPLVQLYPIHDGYLENLLATLLHVIRMNLKTVFIV